MLMKAPEPVLMMKMKEPEIMLMKAPEPELMMKDPEPMV